LRHDNPFDGLSCILLRRRRRLRIGDLLVVVALVALGVSVLTLPEMTDGGRPLMGLLIAAYLALVLLQWGLASVTFRRPRPMLDALLGGLSSVTALSAFAGVVILGLIVPQAAALLSVITLLVVVYMTTWN
jgi:hypothetical protein